MSFASCFLVAAVGQAQVACPPGETLFDQTITRNSGSTPPLASSNPFSFTGFSSGPISSGQITVQGFGDLDGTGGNLERWDVTGETGGVLAGVGASGVFGDQCNTTFTAGPVAVPLVDLTAWAADGMIDFTGSDAGGNINVVLCGADFLSVQLEMCVGPNLMADLSVSKDDGQATAAPGDPLTYTIVVSNAGPDDAVGSMVTDTFPVELLGASWTCVASVGSTCTAGPVAGDIADTADILAGGNATYTVTGTIDPGFLGLLSNTADAQTAAAVADPDPANNSATDVTDVLSPSVLEIPTLSPGGLALLALVLMGAAFLLLRRRRV